MNIVGVLLYIMLVDGQPQVQLEQRPFKTMEVCMAETGKRAREIGVSPRFVDGLHAGCHLLELKAS